jgi:ribosomal-protein-alanine N-acetyltransferase
MASSSPQRSRWSDSEPRAGSFPVLETARLRLRETRESDIEDLFRVYSDPEVTRYYNLDTLTDLEQARQIIRRRQEALSRGHIRWALCLKEDDRYIGSCGLPFSLEYWRVAELGYELARDLWGRGLMTEAVPAVCRYAFDALGMQRVEAQVMPGNGASIRVLEKCGFRCEGLLRGRGFWKEQSHDLLMFGLLREDSN